MITEWLAGSGTKFVNCYYDCAFTFDGSSNAYIAAKLTGFGPSDGIVRRRANGTLELVAGSNSGTYSDGLLATQTKIDSGGSGRVAGIAISADGKTLYYAHAAGHRVRRIANVGDSDPANDIVTTVAGNGSAGYAGDYIPSTDATVRVNYPWGLAWHPAGRLFIADSENLCVRVIW